MGDLSAILFALLQLVLWLAVWILIFSWLTNRIFPKNKRLKEYWRKAARLIFVEPFRKLYQINRWLIIRIFTTRPDYRLRQVYLENYPATPLAFYEAVEEALAQRQIIGVEVLRIARLEWHLLSARRIYLLIHFRDAACFVGAMPLGTSFLVSWRYTIMPSKLWLILLQVPFLGVLIETLLAPPTFYRTDIYYAFEQAVRATVLEAANLLAQRAAGIRPLTENEQRPLLREFYD